MLSKEVNNGRACLKQISYDISNKNDALCPPVLHKLLMHRIAMKVCTSKEKQLNISFSSKNQLLEQNLYV